MKTTGILMKPELVQASIDGVKDVTRRIIPQAEAWDDNWRVDKAKDAPGSWCMRSGTKYSLPYFRCRYGAVGDILYVKETHYAYGYWVKDASGWTFKGHGDVFGYKYMDNPPSPPDILTGYSTETGWYKRPSLFMPRAAARYFFQIEGLWAERVQDITPAMAIREGIKSFRPVPGDGPAETLYWHYIKKKWGPSPVHSFQTLWQSVHGEESWDQNPWVWVVTYKKLHSLNKA